MLVDGWTMQIFEQRKCVVSAGHRVVTVLHLLMRMDKLVAFMLQIQELVVRRIPLISWLLNYAALV